MAPAPSYEYGRLGMRPSIPNILQFNVVLMGNEHAAVEV
jgi:hypothetical protein